MSSAVSASLTPPVYKVGALVLRPAAQGMQVLIVRPQPKRPGEVPPFVLPRGSRQYRDAEGNWHDARDGAIAQMQEAALEPLTATLLREIEEEAGVPPKILRKAKVHELGRREFASRSQQTYPVHWFVVVLDAAALPKLHAVPSDAMAVRWESPAEIEAMAAYNEFSSGYIPVIREALAGWQQLPKVAL